MVYTRCQEPRAPSSMGRCPAHPTQPRAVGLYALVELAGLAKLSSFPQIATLGVRRGTSLSIVLAKRQRDCCWPGPHVRFLTCAADKSMCGERLRHCRPDAKGVHSEPQRSSLRWLARRSVLMILRRLAHALRLAESPPPAGEQRLQLALQLARMSTWEWNVQTGEASWSRELEATAGLAPASFGGTFQSFLELVHPDDREYVRQTLVQAVEETRRFELEYRIVLPDGQTRWRTAAGDVLAIEGGKASRMIGVGQDITERKEAEHRLSQAEGRYRTLVE